MTGADGNGPGGTDDADARWDARGASHCSAREFFKKGVGVRAVRTEEDYARARAAIEVLLDAIGEDEGHRSQNHRNLFL